MLISFCAETWKLWASWWGLGCMWRKQRGRIWLCQKFSRGNNDFDYKSLPKYEFIFLSLKDHNMIVMYVNCMRQSLATNWQNVCRTNARFFFICMTFERYFFVCKTIERFFFICRAVERFWFICRTIFIHYLQDSWEISVYLQDSWEMPPASDVPLPRRGVDFPASWRLQQSGGFHNTFLFFCRCINWEQLEGGVEEKFMAATLSFIHRSRTPNVVFWCHFCDQVAHYFLSVGLGKGDTIAVFMENR